MISYGRKILLLLLAERDCESTCIDWTACWRLNHAHFVICRMALPSTRTTSLSPRESLNSTLVHRCCFFFFFVTPPSPPPTNMYSTYKPFPTIFTQRRSLRPSYVATRESLTCGGGRADFPREWKMYMSTYA